jgi:L-iditol 2-dehydrogenase
VNHAVPVSTAVPASLIPVARLHGIGDIRVTPERAAAPGPGEVRIQVTAVGLCGSDLHWYDEASIGDAGLDRPLVPGHEFAGIVTSGRDAGRRVVADPADPCGRCDTCRRGLSNMCIDARFAGFASTDGALRGEMAWPEHLLQPLPDGVTDDEAALLEPLGVAIHALDLGRAAPGVSAGVYGCGPIGLLIVQALRAAGVERIVATDRLPHRVDAARESGATEVRLVTDELSDGEAASADAVDVAFEAGGTDAAIGDAVAAVRPGGRVVLVGIPNGDRSAFPAGLARRKGLTLLLSRRMADADLGRAVELAANGRVDLGPLITHRYPIGRTPEAFDALSARRGLKVVVNPTTVSVA